MTLKFFEFLIECGNCLFRIGKNQVVQPVSGNLDKFRNAKGHGIAEKPKRNRHSICLRG